MKPSQIAPATTQTNVAVKAKPRSPRPAVNAKPSKSTTAPLSTASPALAPQPEKTPKPIKAKLVRDGFTMPKDEYVQIEALKLRLALLGVESKKSQLLRAGLKLLCKLTDSELLRAAASVPVLKTGRPNKR